MYDFLSGDIWDLRRDNANYKASPPTAQLTDLVKKLEGDFLSQGELTDHTLSMYIKIFNTALLEGRGYCHNFVEDMIPKDAPDEIQNSLYVVMLDNSEWSAIRTFIIEDGYAFSLAALIARGYLLLKDFESKWKNLPTDKKTNLPADEWKLEWYDQFNHNLYIFFNCYLIINEKKLKKETLSDFSRKNANKRHEKSNKTKEDVLSLARLKTSIKPYKSRRQLAKELLPGAKEFAANNNWQPTDDYQFLDTITKWLANEHKNKK